MKGWIMEDVSRMAGAPLLARRLAAKRSDRAGSAWRTLTRIGLIAGFLALAGCGGESANGESDTDGSTNGSGGGSGGNPEVPSGNGTSDASALAYSECGSGGGGCPASDPICLDENGVVSAVTGAGGAETSLLFEVCTRPCETDSDCPVSPDTEARPRCVPGDAGANVCALDCSDGAECPRGMDCSYNDQVCMYLHHAVWSGNCTTDPSKTISCEGDCLGQADVTCTRSCDQTEYTCVASQE
ncbi:MAG TPA: hypothetical protein VFU02_07595 [Polyangiaceae bacterium]|nr:hypothetical protein [Polyangiaceae bacterium]